MLICVQAEPEPEPEPEPEKLWFIHLDQYGLDISVAVAESDNDGGKRVPVIERICNRLTTGLPQRCSDMRAVSFLTCSTVDDTIINYVQSVRLYDRNFFSKERSEDAKCL
jgi:hypothetical protein